MGCSGKGKGRSGWNGANSVSIWYPLSSVITAKISRSSSFWESLVLGRHRWRLLITILSLFHFSEAYKTVSMSGVCKHSGTKGLRLSAESGVSLVLDAGEGVEGGCRIELIAPESHSISLLFTRRRASGGGEQKTEEEEEEEEEGVPRCPLVISFPQLRPEEVKMCLDLCSEEAFKSVEHFTDLVPSRVTLEWLPRVKSSNEILASEIVVAAVGKGRDVCSQAGQFSCKSMGYPIYCISRKLVCDGKRNCPFEGRDESKELCSSEGNYEKVGFGPAETSHADRGWEFLASEFLKKLSSKENGNLRKPDLPSSTEKSAVLWSDDGTTHARDSESLPDVLKHYGPWGYLMLGMLICGTVLMFCGLWECCCRRPKALVSNAVGPALLIVDQGASHGEAETPPTPGPPRYEDLDQPPSYSVLFPSSKPAPLGGPPTATGPSDALPITSPVINSLSAMRTASSRINFSPNFRNVSGSVPGPDAFAAGVPNRNLLDISRDMRDDGSSPK